MQTNTILLFNGLHLSIDAIDTAVAWTQKTNGLLTALFVVADKEQSDGYPFPNDIDLTDEKGVEEEVLGEDIAIIASTIRLLRRQAAIAKIDLQTRIVPNPKEDELREYFENADQIFVTENTLDASVLAVKSERIKDALSGLPAEADWIG